MWSGCRCSLVGQWRCEERLVWLEASLLLVNLLYFGWGSAEWGCPCHLIRFLIGLFSLRHLTRAP